MSKRTLSFRFQFTCLQIAILVAGLITAVPALHADVEFLRGDINADGIVSISDAVMVQRFFFVGDDAPPDCEDAADVNDDGKRDITDSITLVNAMFLENPRGQVVSPPFPAVGADPTADDLTCNTYDVVPPGDTSDTIRIGVVEGAPGEEVEIPVFLTNEVEVEAFQLIVRYDPDVLDFDGFHPGLSFGGTFYEGIDEGPYEFDFVTPHLEEDTMAVVFIPNFINDGSETPPGKDRLVFKIRGTIAADAERGTTIALEPRTDDEGVGPFGLHNEVTYKGQARFLSAEPVVIPGALKISPDIVAFFVRGDVNVDSFVDQSDALAILSHLFLGGDPIPCPDAADANDDGKIDISDPINILRTTFLGASGIAAPYPVAGIDPTPDRLGECQNENG